MYLFVCLYFWKYTGTAMGGFFCVMTQLLLNTANVAVGVKK